ncbi:MAG: hypothetical protein ACE5DX_03280 [Candidatus Dojkabacteria bacterium]
MREKLKPTNRSVQNWILLIIVVCLLLVFFVALARQMTTRNNANSLSLTPKSEGLSMDKLLEIDAIEWAASVLATEQGPFCEDKAEVKRKCGGCRKAVVTYTRSDCSKYKKTRKDQSCTSDCPVPTQNQVQNNYRHVTPQENIKKPSCVQGEEVSRFCIACGAMIVSRKNSDCSVYAEHLNDEASCYIPEYCPLL